MAQSMEVYFKNENDAEAAKTKIQALETKNVIVEPLPENNRTKWFIPFLGSGDMAIGAPTGVNPSAPEPIENKTGQEKASVSYVMRFEVSDHAYDAAMKQLADSRAYEIKKEQ